MLECQNLLLKFGEVTAVEDVSFSIDSGELLSIVGANGAGKTSTLNLINGFHFPDDGEIVFNGEDITYMPAWKRARRGLARTFQHVELMSDMNIVENLMPVQATRNMPNILETMLFLGPGKRKEEENIESIESILTELDLMRHRDTAVGNLPLAEQKRVELARALTLDPDILLVDEVMSGLAHEEKREMARYLLDIRDTETSVVMIEHDLEVATQVTERMIVLDEGKVLFDGPPDAAMSDRDVQSVYLGEA